MIMATRRSGGLQDRERAVWVEPLGDPAAGRFAERRLRGALRALGRAGDRHVPVLHQDGRSDCGGLFRSRAAASRRDERTGREAFAYARSRRTELSEHAPDFRNNWDLAVAVFIMPFAVQWWAVWYPGAEPGGGSYIAQRMLASKSEKDSLGGDAVFQPCPLCCAALALDSGGLASLIVYPPLQISSARLPYVDPS